MGRVAFFDCYSGASGNMILGALIDAGLDVDVLRQELSRLGLSGYQIVAERAVKSGMTGIHVDVALDEAPQPHRSLTDIERIIDQSTLAEGVKTRASAIFRRLGSVEARIHGTPVEDVHFHEVGAVDAIVDIVGACIGVELLGIESVHVSSLPLGQGSVRSAHGLLPLPAPATLALLADAHAPTRPVDTELELVTPTGAAILTTLGEFTQPRMVLDRIGVGVGTRTLPWPNVLRVWTGESSQAGLNQDEVVVIETNLDDGTPEQAGYAMERLMEAGALDVFFTPVQMKKNRPGVMLTVLGAPSHAEMLAGIVLRETTSLGVRIQTSQRLICARRVERIDTELGPMQVKIKSIDGREVVCPEYEECARVARERALPIGEVYAAVVRAGRGGN